MNMQNFAFGGKQFDGVKKLIQQRQIYSDIQYIHLEIGRTVNATGM